MNLTGSGPRPGGHPPYRFDDVVVDPAAHSLLRGGEPQPLEPKAFAVLLALLQRPGELIARDDLLDLAWGHRHVTPGVLTRAIAQLRPALGDDSQQPRYIQTRHALGYRFIGRLQVAPDAAPEPQAEEPAPAVDAGAQAPAVTSPPEWTPADLAPATMPAVDRRRRVGLWLVLVLLLAAALAWGLKRFGGSTPVAASVAVMPFTSLGGRPDDAYFAEGLAEEMRDALAGVKGLKVAASVAPAMRGVAADARALGARLGVATILDASVRREGSRLRITARLTDTASGFTLWSHTYDRELAGVFDTQTEIAGEVVQALLGARPDGEGALARRLVPTHNEAAFDNYLQGLHLLHRSVTAETAEQAIRHFDQALRQDSGFARAQAGICRAEIWRFQSKHSAAAFDNARHACQRAAQMDPGLAEVDLALGDLYRAAGDAPRALEHYGKSAKAPAQAVAAHVGMAQVHAAQGKRDLAVAEFRRAAALDPGNGLVYANIGYQQYLDGKPQQAVASYQRAVQLQPDDAEFWGTLGALQMEAGDNAAATSALEHAIAIAPTAATLTNLGLLRYQAGAYAAAADLQRQATALDPQDFMTWGNLGDALRADPRAAPGEAREAFAQAAQRVESYLKVKPDDARAVAALGFYRLMLGDSGGARELVGRSETLSGQPGEVALLNAETLALLGELEPARQRLQTARPHGIADTLIAGNPPFRRLGLLSPAGDADKPAGTENPAPRGSKGHPDGG